MQLFLFLLEDECMKCIFQENIPTSLIFMKYSYLFLENIFTTLVVFFACKKIAKSGNYHDSICISYIYGILFSYNLYKDMPISYAFECNRKVIKKA